MEDVANKSDIQGSTSWIFRNCTGNRCQMLRKVLQISPIHVEFSKNGLYHAPIHGHINKSKRGSNDSNVLTHHVSVVFPTCLDITRIPAAHIFIYTYMIIHYICMQYLYIHLPTCLEQRYPTHIKTYLHHIFP